MVRHESQNTVASGDSLAVRYHLANVWERNVSKTIYHIPELSVHIVQSVIHRRRPNCKRALTPKRPNPQEPMGTAPMWLKRSRPRISSTRDKRHNPADI